MTAPPIITLLTDFGERDAYAGIMKGVILDICPAARLVDLTHAVPAQAVRLGALVLRSAVPYFPPGTIHVAVVDPGVGSERAAVAVLTDRAVLVGPDNGLLAPSAALLGLREVRRLDNGALFRTPVSATFHGRDVFAPVAAHLAAGTAFDRLGSPLGMLQPLDLPEPVARAGVLVGEVLHVDHFGNLITNLPDSALRTFPARNLSVTIAGMTIAPFVRAYADASPGVLLALIGSWGLLEIAVRDGSAAARLSATVGADVRVSAG